MTNDVRLKPATPEDASFVESIYFETQRWIIQKLFGWRGDDFEHAKFRDKFYHERDASIIVAGGKPVGWIAMERNGKTIHLDHVYLTTEAQRHGIGTTLLRRLMAEAKGADLPLTLSTAKINPATKLYDRLGFTVMGSDKYKTYLTWWPKGDLRFTSATEQDADEIARLHHLVRETSMPYLPTLHTVEDTTAFFEEVVTRRSVPLARTGELLIGYCAYGDGWLDHLYVHPGYQRLKIGSALLQKAMASEPTLKLWVFQKNHDAIRFYENVGFTRVRETKGAGNEEREPDVLYAWTRDGA
jgi:putative acetyltransferase